MKFVLCVEGQTEHKVLAEFLKRWLDHRLSGSVGVSTANLRGLSHFLRKTPRKALEHLDGPRRAKTIAVIGLLDLYGPQHRDFYPKNLASADERYTWGKREVETQVGHERFRMFFAVHEVEAWILSQPEIIPPEVRRRIGRNLNEPERVDFGNHPSKVLNDAYRSGTDRTYKKTVHGRDLFNRLDPEVAYEKCPHLKEMLDDMLQLARQAGL